VGEGEVELTSASAVGDDPLLPLRTAVAAATHRAAIERRTLERLALESSALPDPWPSDGRRLFAELLLAGPPAIPVIEALDQRGVWVRFLPEWAAVRARPQHNAYHRFTVDRHLLETVANAARLAEGVARPDLLAIAALLHDLGKGYDGDHTQVGVELALRIGARMGYPDEDLSTLAALVQYHLLLPDVATRRDLSDVATIERVAAAAGSVERLQLLAALTEADAVATGPSAWSPWKAELIRELVQRATQLLTSGDPDHLTAEPFPTRDQLARLREAGQRIDAVGDVVTIMTDDRPGIFSRVAGALTLHGLDVLAAAAHSTDDGRALSVFRISDPFRDTPPWDRVIKDLELALDGRLALPARVAERARLYTRAMRQSRHRANVAVHFDNDASDEATVIDVHAPDAIGVLYQVTRALADLDLDIRSARVQTLGAEVVDAFYVRDRFGKKVTDQHSLNEIDRAIVHCLAQGTGSTH
jgi:[protein-PII] uridylyltransferase